VIEVDEGSTRQLLSKLDNEIERKCMELQERQHGILLKRVFFLSCVLVLFLFLMEVFFKVFNINFLIVFFVFQAASFLMLLPVVLNLNKSRIG